MVDIKELAYTAGLFDGEGSISWVRHHDNHIFSSSIHSISDYEVVNWFQERLVAALLPNNCVCQTIRSLMAGG